MRIKLTGSHRIELVRLSVARCIAEPREQRNLRGEVMIDANARRIHVGRKRSAGNSGLGHPSRITGRIQYLRPSWRERLQHRINCGRDKSLIYVKITVIWNGRTNGRVILIGLRGRLKEVKPFIGSKDEALGRTMMNSGKQDGRSAGRSKIILRVMRWNK